MLSNLITRPCTITRRTQSAEADRYGDEIPGTSTVETVCEVQQQRRSEQDDQPLGRGEWIAFFLPTEELSGADSIEIEGHGVFEFDGPPWLADTGPAELHHWEANLVKVADEEPAS